jgi:hypothetical protein
LNRWHERFREEPNVYADICDVLVSTTVIGVEFPTRVTSIAYTPLPSLTGVLTFEEERQFLVVALAAGAERQSYLFVQKGWGDPQAFGMVYATYESLQDLRSLWQLAQTGKDNHSFRKVGATHRRLV